MLGKWLGKWLGKSCAPFLVLLCLAGALRPAEPSEAPPVWDRARTWALLVGVLSWQDPSLASFPTEKRQDRALEQALLGSGVPRAQLTFVEDEEATLERVREELVRTAEAAGEGSTLLLYFAGHGLQEGKQTWFANYDVKAAEPATTAWGMREIGEVLAKRWKGRQLVLLADCCHSGALREVVDAVAKREGVAAACITSALDCNLSTGRWTFTESVVAGLKGDARLDRDEDGHLDFGELDAYVTREMRFREGQLTVWHRTPAFDPRTLLAEVDVATLRGARGSRWRVGDFVEAQWKEKWWRAEVIDTRADAWKVRYLGFDKTWDEWLAAARVRAATPIDRKKGEEVEIEWKGKWWPGAILEVRDDFAFVHYDGFGDEWDEWATAKRLRARSGR